MENKEKLIYSVATAHLDTVWNWDFETTVAKYIYATMVDNFKNFEKYPDFEFNFEGSYRYELMEEYYPELFETVKDYVKKGRWHPCGSAFENGDVNVPSPEALFRNILYGNSYFQKTFGKRSTDIYLPDCFGFGWALPSIIRHANLLGFTTQKLTWGSAYGTPFDIGRWYGVNGDWCYASVNPGSYTHIYTQIRGWKFLQKKLEENEKFGLDCTYSYHGVGDRGGSPKEHSIAVLQKEIDANDRNGVKIISAAADKIYYDLDGNLTDEQKEKLPVWKNELVMQNHAVGGYTSRAIGKRWNTRCQELADCAERSAVAAAHLGMADYPQKALEKAWKRTIAHQFHDDLPGTSVERAYQRSWNDYVLSMNQFSNEYEAAAGSVAALMNTKTDGVAVVVNNPIEQPRKECVTATLTLPKTAYVRVYAPDGTEALSQITDREGDRVTVRFIAEVPAMGYKVYHVKQSDSPCEKDGSLRVTENCLENAKYRVSLNADGDIQSIFDKTLHRDILKAPIRLGLYKYNGSASWPAWEMNYKEMQAGPAEYAKAAAKAEIIEDGAASVALRVRQFGKGSEFTTVISLSACGELVEVHSEIMWHSLRTLLKAQFPLICGNANTVYDLGLGAITRKNSSEKLFEVPAQRWADLTAEDGTWGVSVLSDCKHGWDKPDDNTLRLTVLHTPRGNYRLDSMQSLMDLGLNRYGYAIYAHEGDYTNGTNMAARCFVTPMTAFVCDAHAGELGTEYSFGAVSTPDVLLRAVKKAEETDEIVVRFYESANRAAEKVTFTLADGIDSAREIYASEEYKGEATVTDGKLIFSVKPFEVKSFALTLKPAKAQGGRPEYTALTADRAFEVMTDNNHRGACILPGTDYSLPAELVPETLTCGGVPFKTGVKTLEAVIADGQTVPLPEGAEKLYFLASSLKEDKEFTFTLGDTKKTLKIQSALERPAAWDLYDFKETAYIKRDVLGYEITHTHSADHDNVAKQFFTFMYTLDVSGRTEITLPVAHDLLILAMTAGKGRAECAAAAELYDSVEKRPFTYEMPGADKAVYKFKKAFAGFRK